MAQSDPPPSRPRRGFGRRLLDLWQARYAKPVPGAREAVSHLRPAVVVTGGSRGIGLALARRFGEAGHAIALVARQAAPLREAAAGIEREFDVPAVAIVLEITHDDAIQELEAHLAQNGLYLDVLVNCAGTGLSGEFASHDDKQIAQLIELNMSALTRLMRHVLPAMQARARGGILNVASLGGLIPGPYQAAYYASKAYVISLTEAVGYETRGTGVRLCAVAPGPVNTDFHAAMNAEHSFYRQLIFPLSPERTARSAYRGYVLGCRLVVPGILNKVMAVALRILPHTLMLPLIGWLLKPREERSWSLADNDKT